MSQAHRDAGGFHFWARSEDKRALIWLKMIICKFTQSTCVVTPQRKWSLITYCESGAQNDHIIFLIHVVSPPLPSRPLFFFFFCLEKSRVLKERMPVSPQTRKLAPFLCPCASNGSFKVKWYLLVITHRWPVEYTVHTVTGEDDQRWPWSCSTLEQCCCASGNSAYPSSLFLCCHTMESNWKDVCNTKPRSEIALSSVCIYAQFRFRLWLGVLYYLPFTYILTKSVCSLFSFLSFLSSRRRSDAWMQAVVSLRHHSCVDGSCFHWLDARRSFQ